VENDEAIPGRSGAADRRRAAHREDELVLGVAIELILGADHEIVETRARAAVCVVQDAKRLGEEHPQIPGNKSAVGGGNVDFVRGGRGGGVRQPHKVGGIVEVGRGGHSGCQCRGEEAVSDVGRRPFRTRREQEQKAGYKPSRPPTVQILLLQLPSGSPVGRYQRLSDASRRDASRQDAVGHGLTHELPVKLAKPRRAALVRPSSLHFFSGTAAAFSPGRFGMTGCGTLLRPVEAGISRQSIE
jgi:hypothetical protein